MKKEITEFKQRRHTHRHAYEKLNFSYNRITWIDNDGDTVTILADEELIIALTEMKGPVYKLSVDVLSGKEEEGEENASKKRI
jgi:hypothetical protein